MKSLLKVLLGVGLAAGVMSVAITNASASIVCTGHTCWHTHESYSYPHSARIVVHEDNWRWGPRERYVFREHEGRGYWHGRNWVEW
jgi:hypothetical protein